MDRLEDITKEVPPTGFAEHVQKDPIIIDDLITKVLSSLTTDQAEMFKTGQVKCGKRNLTTLDIIKESLYKEIESLNLTKTADIDKIERTINSKTKKVLKQQVDSIISVLQMSTESIDNRYFILGLLLKLLLLNGNGTII